MVSEVHNDIDYSQCDCSNAYNTMVTCGIKLNHALSQETITLAIALHAEGFISQSTLDETMELNETNSNKGSRLYNAVLKKVENYPEKFANFVGILRCNRVLYNDVLNELDRVYCTCVSIKE